MAAQERAKQLRQEMEEAQRQAELLDANRGEAEAEACRLREELEAERSKGLWRRLFGG